MAMAFLIFMSLFALTAFKGSTVNLRIIGNMQSRQEALSVAQKALEQTITSNLFTSNPAAVANRPIPVDIDGNQTVDYSAFLNPPPRCYRTKVIRLMELNPALPADLKCLKSGISGSEGLDLATPPTTTGDSLCANTEWNLAATVEDPRTGARVILNQGVMVRVLGTDSANFCS